ncbi:MAG: chaperonin GroEL, partial [Firmicutes bacterium]|nr:chaperonin GroEL [Bacillota bacterium]
VAYLNVASALNKLEDELKGDEATGMVIVRRALEEPLRVIAENAGAEGSVVVEKVKGMEQGFGFNAVTNEFEKMIDSGIVDPTKVARSAVQNAASIAGMLLTTESIVTDLPDKNSGMPAMPTPDMPMM